MDGTQISIDRALEAPDLLGALRSENSSDAPSSSRSLVHPLGTSSVESVEVDTRPAQRKQGVKMVKQNLDRWALQQMTIDHHRP